MNADKTNCNIFVAYLRSSAFIGGQNVWLSRYNVERWKNTMFDKGIAIRREMFGAELADKAWAAADDFNRPLEELVNQYCFGEIWGRPGLDRKTRSIVTLSMLTGLNRPNQIRAHVKGAIANGVSKEELKELFLQAAIYCGVPAAVDSFRIAREVFQEMGI